MMTQTFTPQLSQQPETILEMKDIKQALARHSLYAQLNTPDRLRHFMAHHVFCVWDFMSLVKSLQQQLTCTAVPWMPPAYPELCRLINEIVLDEESDEIEGIGILSHFDLYHRAMQEVEADTRPIDAFLSQLKSAVPLNQALQTSNAPKAAQEFVQHTFQVLQQPLVIQANVFFHAREDLIPRMFLTMVEALQAQGLACETLLLYLDRHLLVDTDKHGPMAKQLIQNLTQQSLAEENNPENSDIQNSINQWVNESLQARLTLWNEIETTLPE
jgi:hypothetical protein